MSKKKEAKRNEEKLKLLNSKLELNWSMQQEAQKEIGIMVGNLIGAKSRLKSLMKEEDKLHEEKRKINPMGIGLCR